MYLSKLKTKQMKCRCSLHRGYWRCLPVSVKPTTEIRGGRRNGYYRTEPSPDRRKTGCKETFVTRQWPAPARPGSRSCDWPTHLRAADNRQVAGGSGQREAAVLA